AVTLDDRANVQAAELIACHRREIVAIAIEQNHGGSDVEALVAQAHHRSGRRDAQGPEDPAFVDLAGRRPTEGCAENPGGRAFGDLGAALLGHELRVAKPFRHLAIGDSTVDHAGADRNGSGKRSAADLVEADHEGNVAKQMTLELERRVDGAHSLAASGTPRKAEV